MTHLRFEKEEREEGKKTDKFKVFNNDGECLGLIHWRGGWRQYVFTEHYEFKIDWSWDCLQEKANFIKQLMDERKKK